MNAPREKLDSFLLQKNISPVEAFHFFDSLESVEIPFLKGLWQGKEFPAAHPFGGLLPKVNWYGKEFITPQIVHPLVMEKKNKERYFLNPVFIPFHLPIEKIPHFLLVPVFKFVSPLMKTNAPKARLGTLEYRGKLSAAMIYDHHGINDIFRKVDENTVLGVMETRNPKKSGYFFVLERNPFS
ncbi:DUF4334 domain-containing protein [Alkalicoccus daliensis]|uniref:GXWXG protein n=1 Tax=Alkalicoccus daliensis TaxID=745820 RepID=A0A1H0HIE4_9BACI|nr:DUF4334 domain-containing protein [Alkalicoccus daliensis]SDO18803.1 GXWXG protein [Alkalicoccus daliensis]